MVTLITYLEMAVMLWRELSKETKHQYLINRARIQTLNTGYADFDRPILTRPIENTVPPDTIDSPAMTATLA